MLHKSYLKSGRKKQKLNKDILKMNDQLLQYLSSCKQNLDYYEGLEKSYSYCKQSIFAWIIFTALKIVCFSPILASFTLWCLEFIYIGDFLQSLFGREDCMYVLMSLFAALFFVLSVKKRADNKQTIKDIKKIFSSPEYHSFYQQASSVLGEKYCTAHACGKFLEYLSSGRCADLMMAKNIYEQELAQERIEKAIRDRISSDLAAEQREQRHKASVRAENERIQQDTYRRMHNN